MTAHCGEVDPIRDRDLVLRYQRGDTGAFEELYLAYFPRLHRYCRRHVGDGHVAEELAQEAFVRALRALPTLQGERRFYPWMTVIARRLCIDHLRRDGRSEPRAEVELGHAAGADEPLLAQLERLQVGEALQRLRDRHREVLHLREWEELSYEAIADRIDAPVTTVQSLLVRARTAFRREFLAVSDGTLAALPLLGVAGAWRARRLRAAEWCREALAPVQAIGAPGAAALTAVVVLAGLPPVAGAADPTPVPPAAPTVVEAPAPAPASDAPAPAASPAPPPTATASVEESPPAAAAPSVPASVRLGDDGAEETHRRALQMPVASDGPVGFAGITPDEIVRDVVEGTLDLLGGDR
jgi:RNA polymerase sigma-70 factor, ECF subfamily